LPIYEFACQECDTRFEELVRAADPSAACPVCGSGATTRLMSAFSMRSVSSGGSDLAQAMTRAGNGVSGGCCGGSCGCH
jgi:putative FmdB family regulatory protein